MTLAEVLPEIRGLPRTDKLQLIKLLTEDVAKGEPVAAELPSGNVPMWSTFDSFEGAAVLLDLLSTTGEKAE